MATPDQHIDGAKRRLTHLSDLASRTEATERRILESATDRRSVVAADLDKLRPRVNSDPTAADRYQSLTVEMGHIETVIAQAGRVLGQ